MTEKLLQYIWQYQIFNSIGLTTIDQQKITILHPGSWNAHQGPDFMMSRILINDREWIGNTELHIKTSDWLLHQHDKDANYRNVVLHVVWRHDKDQPNTIPVIELEPRVPVMLLDKYQEWSLNKSFISCAGSIQIVDQKIIQPYLSWLLSQRIHQKSKSVQDLVNSLAGDWEEAFWRQLARGFGHKVNADSFERIAQSVPYKQLYRHAHDVFQLEAILFGQAGLVYASMPDEYGKALYEEFQFLKNKFRLKKSVFPVYFLRMRPINFPTIRLAQLAALIHKVPDLFRCIRECTEITELKKLLRVKAAGYWEDHYRFGETSIRLDKTTADGLLDKLIINTVLPFLRAYYVKRGDTAKIELLDRWPSEMKSEYNSIVSGFASLGIQPRNMGESQGLLELKSAYCDQLKCLDCAMGRFILRRSSS